MAAVYEELSEPNRARELRRKAAKLYHQFNDIFWDDASGFYAYALDGDKKKVLTVASNPGHCLWSGIVPPDRAAKVVARLMAPDMWSGWGIRTLSSANPAFNPYNYQTGSVWPHDNGIIALGFKRYGFSAEAARIARDISEAGSHFKMNSLPELYTVAERSQSTFPVQYLGANVPQAWAAGAVFHLLQAMLGFSPDGARGKLYVDPALPAWLPDITLIDVCAAGTRFDIRFFRDGGSTKYEVLRGDASAVEQKTWVEQSRALRDEVLGSLGSG